MDFMVQMEDRADDSSMMAQDHSMPGVPYGSTPRHDVVTLDGAAGTKALALADESAVADWLDSMREADALTFDCENDDAV
ncbi:MAG: hypothetical protein WCK74_12740 [Gemmatimonadaceae bacterium]|jgi:hypothetical protein